MPSEVYEKLKSRALVCAEEIGRHKSVRLISHIDADGITSAAIAGLAFERAGIPFETFFVKKLDERFMDDFCEKYEKDGSLNDAVLVFTDLGSSMTDYLVDRGLKAVVCDHHQPSGRPENISADSKTFPFHMNPHLFGANGSYEISGSGVTYILADAVTGGRASDLAALALVGAVGDMQNRKFGKFVSLNSEILEEGVSAGVLSYGPDLGLFGKQTRPVYRILQYSSEPYLPGLTGDEEACIRFLEKTGIAYHKEDGARLWIELSMDERRTLISALIDYCLNHNFPPRKAESVVRECYTLLKEKEGTEMRDASEFATLLNATGRYDCAEIGVRVCMGDRGVAFDEARDLLAEHRKNLVNGLNYVKEHGMTQMTNIQYFYSGSEIKETIVGIIAGMSSSVETVDRNKPVIGLADAEDGIKVSGRGTQDLIGRGLNLSRAMADVSEACGGAGGGHDIAAGATIPPENMDRFLKILDVYIGSQMK